MPTIAYTITLEQPALTTSLVGDPNSTVSYDYIPGSALRGLFAGRFRGGPGGADDALFRALFISGKARFLSAYPLSPDSARCLPTPRSLQQPKGDNGDSLQNRAIDLGDPRVRWKGLGRPFCAETAEDKAHKRLQLLTPLRSVAVHVQRDRQKGRAWLVRPDPNTDIRYGTVFRYEALAAGQRFAALILADDDLPPENLETLRALLRPATCWIGRSRSAGYGRASLAEQEAPEGWREAATAAPTGPVHTMTLLSPAILRSSLGEEVQRLDNETLSAHLGWEVEIIPERTFSEVELVGGFNRHWGLPLPQQRALAMGSVITFKVRGDTLDSGALEARGIGERLAEGFGRVAFNWLSEPSYQGQVVDPPSTTSAPAPEQPAIPPSLRPLATRTANRLLDTRIDAAIVAFVQRYVWPQVLPGADRSGERRDRMPSNSQLSRLHTLVRQATAAGNTDSVRREFLHFRDTARFAFERARLAENKGSLAEWVYSLLTQPQLVWSELAVSDNLQLGDVAPARGELRTRQVALRLLAAVLAAPAQRRKGSDYVEAEERQ